MIYLILSNQCLAVLICLLLIYFLTSDECNYLESLSKKCIFGRNTLVIGLNIVGLKEKKISKRDIHSDKEKEKIEYYLAGAYWGFYIIKYTYIIVSLC